MMSLNLCCTVIDRALASPHDITLDAKKNSQTRGMEVKPRLVEIFETQMWQQGDAADSHYLLHTIQLSRSQATIKELEVNLDGKRKKLL